MPDWMNFLLVGTICLAYAHGHSNNLTKPKLGYKFGSVYFCFQNVNCNKNKTFFIEEKQIKRSFQYFLILELMNDLRLNFIIKNYYWRKYKIILFILHTGILWSWCEDVSGPWCHQICCGKQRFQTSYESYREKSQCSTVLLQKKYVAHLTFFSAYYTSCVVEKICLRGFPTWSDWFVQHVQGKKMAKSLKFQI